MTEPAPAGDGRRHGKWIPGSTRTWTILGVVSAILIGVGGLTFAALQIVIGLLPYWGVHPPSAPAASPPAASPTDLADSADPATEASPASDSGCRGSDGMEINCAAPGSGIMVAVATCTPSAVRDAWGYPAGVPLAITVSSAAEGCLVLPSEIAAEAGANGTALYQASQGQLESRMLACARTDGATAASCAAPHEYEWVSEWNALAQGEVPETWCHELGAAYTANTLGSESRLRSYVFTNGEGSLRCAVGADRSTLTGSLWRIGGKEIPRG